MPNGRKSLTYIYDNIDYLEHQLDGIRRMARMGSFLLADDMGLGKTLQAMTVAAIDFDRCYDDGTPWAERVLVVCPATLKGNWAAELEKFTKFSYVVLSNKSPKERAEQLEKFDAQFLIVNYEQVLKHVEDFNEIGFQITIFDEAHYLKNPSSERTKTCFKLKYDRAFLLTGSPLLNQVNELWSLLHLIDPITWPRRSYWKFRNHFCKFGGWKNKEVVGIKNRDELYEILQNVMIRRRKTDVLDLPDKQEIPIYVELTPLQERLVKQATDDLLIELSGNPNPMEIENALVKMLRIKQILGTPATIGEDDKSQRLDEMVNRAQQLISEGHAMTVWSQFLGVLDAMEARCKAAKPPIPYYRIDGSVPAAERPKIVQAWTAAAERGDPHVLLLMLDSQARVAATGLNMTAASHTFFLDRLYVPKLNEQAEDRHHRIGQKNQVQVFIFMTRNTVEKRIADLIKRKREVFDDIVESNAPQAGGSNWKAALYAALAEKDED